MKIWGYCKQRGTIEQIDTCGKREVGYIIGQYQMAFGAGWIIWAGLKRDFPGTGGR